MRQCLIAFAVHAATCAMVATDEGALPGAKTVNSTVIEEFAVATRGDLLVLPVTIGDQACRFAVDTGCMTTILDSSFEGRLKSAGRSIESQGRCVPLYKMPAARLGKTGIPVDGDVACFSLAPIGRATGHELQGILGMNFLRRHIVEFDFDAGKLSFLRSARSDAGAAFQISYDAVARPTIGVALTPRQSVPVLIDTGLVAPGLVEIATNTFDQLEDDGRLTLIDQTARMILIGGAATDRKAVLDRLSVGPFESQQLGVREGSLNAFGLDYLSRYVVTLDFRGNKAYFKKGRRFDHPSRFDMSGMALSRRDGKVLIEQVHEGGPAQTIGLKPGDVIVSVQDQDAGDSSLFDFRRLLAQEGKTVRLVVQRMELTKEFELPLSNWQKIGVPKD